MHPLTSAPRLSEAQTRRRGFVRYPGRDLLVTDIERHRLIEEDAEVDVLAAIECAARTRYISLGLRVYASAEQTGFKIVILAWPLLT